MEFQFENKIDTKIKKELSYLHEKDLKNPVYMAAVKSRGLPAHFFDDQINNFHDKEIEKEIKNIKLSPQLEKEIYLFYWVKINGYEGTKKNYSKIQDFLFKVKSRFYNRLNFYRYEFNKVGSDQNMVYKNFIKTWEIILIKNVVEYRMIEIEEKRIKFIQKLYDYIEIYVASSKLLKTVWNFFGDVFEETLAKNLNMEILESFANYLQNNPAIMEIASLIGRQTSKSELIEERKMLDRPIKTKIRPVYYSTEEIVGVSQSNVLEHTLTTEFAVLGIPVLETLFYKKMLESQLQVFDFIALDEVPERIVEERVYNVEVPDKKGPIVLCIDTSASMQGSPEQIAKSLALAITKIAIKEKRNFYMINFSGGIEVLDFSKTKTMLSSLVDFLSQSFNGSTNIEPAITHAARVMNQKKWHNSDMLMISDFLNPDLSEDTLERVKHLKSIRNRFHAISIGILGNKNTQQLFNNSWTYDPRDPFTSEKIISDLSNELNSDLKHPTSPKEIFESVSNRK
ncbi:two-component regulator system yiem receptor component protein [Spiroplasma sp. TIUS-1]|uniref:VWA domain-containing protein n=1 Tax=Spiroplasma sp. TIUS-1 TaxID=216963 RepID=UPI001396E423|nr:VWA domain-containing protein [Spiroplasma sp. TIUS-1]QHX35815.1 two-component regulator system yiem receptor component protein [Spiroplasma sp. TIUS-1]